MRKNPHIRFSNVILGLSSALDLVNWFVVDHHRQVTSFASSLAAHLGFSDEDKASIAIASALHDIGAISFNEKFNLAFEAENTAKHAELGYQLLQQFKPFLKAADLVRYHHLAWKEGRGGEHDAHRVPRGSHIIHLADRVAVLISREAPVLKQVDSIRSIVEREKGKLFVPEIVEAFLDLSDRECFWLQAAYPPANGGTDGTATAWNIELDLATLLDLSELFRMIIDFRSPLTATHSKDVAQISQTIARLVGFSEQEATALHIAGNLHDLGKLAVPVELLEKEGPLTRDDLYIMKSHSFHTYRVLDGIGGLDDITLWAALHHECLDGTGYPFRYRSEDLPLGARIVAVADILSALTETRSYRAPLPFEEAMAIMKSMGRERKLDAAVVSLVESNAADIRDVKRYANDQALREFHQIKADVEAQSMR